MSILPSFDRHQAEGRLVGLMVAEWGELEFLLAHCVGMILKDPDAAFRAIFGRRGETRRIETAAKLARPLLTDTPDLSLFDQMIDGLRVCVAIRNLYAHSHWLYDSRGLLFVNIEEVARLPATIDLRNLEQYPVNVPHLEAQEAYFRLIAQAIDHLNFAAQIRNGPLRHNPIQRPTMTPPPPVKLPPSSHRLEVMNLLSMFNADRPTTR